MYPLMEDIWGHIWKRTVEKSQTNATNATMPPLVQTIWGNIWKHTVGKSQTNATSVTLHHLGQAIWEHIWKRTVEKGQTNVWLYLVWPKFFEETYKEAQISGERRKFTICHQKQTIWVLVLGTFSNFAVELVAVWRLKPFLYLYCRAQRKQIQESIWFDLVCYGGLNRKNQKKVESGSLMLKSYFYSILCQTYLDLDFQQIRYIASD